MNTHGKKAKQYLAILCTVLIFLYAAIAFLPHECIDTDCALCTIMEVSRQLLLGLVWVVAIGLSADIALCARSTRSAPLSFRDATPVGLKVKLSD